MGSKDYKYGKITNLCPLMCKTTKQYKILQIDVAFLKYMQSLKENYKYMHTHERNYISMKNMTNVYLTSFEIIKICANYQIYVS